MANGLHSHADNSYTRTRKIKQLRGHSVTIIEILEQICVSDGIIYWRVEIQDSLKDLTIKN